MIITKTNIDMVFDELWPTMMLVHDHKQNCLNQISSIQNYFKKKSDHNMLLNNLCSLDGIGITIGTGLIWSAYPDTRVPFDTYTLTYALTEKIIATINVSENYVLYSDKIKKYCDKRQCTIEDFVRESTIELEDYEFLQDPL